MKSVLSSAEVESRELAHILTAALERMREGTYGKCAFCDSSIPLARLQALPYAMSCIQCQRELEKRGLDVNSPIDWEAMTRDGILGGDASFLET